MRLVSLIVAAVVGAAGASGDRSPAGDQQRPAARGNASAEIFAHTARQLYHLDLSGQQPQARLVGDFHAQITDIARTSDGTLYGVSFTHLYRIDLGTGRAQQIGALGTRGVNGLAATGGRLVASSTEGVFYYVDPATGRATAAGRFGSGVTSSGDLCFGPGGVLYMTAPLGAQGSRSPDRLVRLDPVSGRATVVGPVGFSQVYGLASRGGDLIGVTSGGAVVRFDLQTGRASLAGVTGVPFWGGA